MTALSAAAPTRRAALLASLGGLAACATPAAPVVADPSGRADPEMRALLESLAALNPRPIETLTPEEARRQPTMADAVARRARELGRAPAPRPLPGVTDVSIPGGAGPLRARLYTPVGFPQPPGTAPLPMIVYYHGGGWVVADLDVYDASARALAADAGALVLSTRYRQGPEFRFPAAHDDAYAAYLWARQNAARLGADPSRIALAGESAGGNLAVATALSARASGQPLPVALGLVYPVAGTDTSTPSYRTFAGAKPLNAAMIDWFVRHYTNGGSDLADPRLDVYRRADLRGLPRTAIVNAEIDPLLDDGARLEEALARAGVPVARRVFPGVAHEFFGADPAVLSKAGGAQRFLASELRAAFLAAPASPAAQPRGRRAARPGT